MASFQASLIGAGNIVSITTNSDCSLLTITDSSNYGTNTSPSSALANFSNFIKITTTYLPNNSVYTMQSTPIVTPTLNLFNIAPPSNGNPVYPLPITPLDGAYMVVLQTVPTYDNSQVAYVVGVSQVYNPTDGLIYTCLQQGAGHRPDLSPTYWVVATVIGMNYTDIQTICLDCSLLLAIPIKISAALCGGAFDCENPCANDDFMDALKLIMIRYSVWIQTLQGKASQTNLEFNYSNSIINCP